MKIGKIFIENFGPFSGTHEIDLSVTPSAKLVLVHGENERGKTSLANAIRWCLYRTAMGRGGATIPTSRLLNNDARLSGAFNISVSLEFEHEGVPYRLERHAQADRLPTQDADFQFRSSLRKKGHFEPEASIERSIRDILHPQISRFFLFDGEMLNDYEDLLRDPYHRTTIVKQSIEQILGLPSIQKAAGALVELRRSAERSQLQEARARRANEQLIAQAQQKEEALNALEKDIQSQNELKASLEQERDQLRQKMEQFGEIRADLRDLDRCDRDVSQIDLDSTGLRKEIQLLLRDNWWIPLEKVVAEKAALAETKASEAAQAIAEREGLRRQVVDLQTAAESSQCSVCGHQLDDAEVAAVRNRKDQIELELDRLKDIDDPKKHFDVLGQLRPFVRRDSHQSLREKEASLRRLAIRKRQLQMEIEQIRERVKKDYRAEIGQVERDLERCISQLGDVGRLLRDANAKRDEADAALQRLQTQIRNLPSANKRLATQSALYEGLRRIFEMAIEEFRQRLRVEVEKEASKIHKALSTEPGYGGLRINEQFGLSLVNDRGRVISDRSAGSEQIVALSLIGALNRCATREGPIVMDTPFGRLDRRHRQNVLKFAPKLGAQVVLLVQSGELERDRDLSDIAQYVAREYRIERDGASDRSRIVEIV